MYHYESVVITRSLEPLYFILEKLENNLLCTVVYSCNLALQVERNWMNLDAPLVHVARSVLSSLVALTCTARSALMTYLAGPVLYVDRSVRMKIA